ncbi:TetR/AcrR family transcriptional regulator [Verrucomicrobium spinosum]|uniref:TetR/AcrR family transcriptional regulator n=1 Tax=Verrucomicrobium spinosum TaxID=2736 RepID=UPI000174509D|nr:TetR/AcrR family transcriptional regulator [Verrucomicrobium spinosum]
MAVTLGQPPAAYAPDRPRSSHTREALLDAAEQLLVEHGVAGTSTRAIIKAAGANLGAVNYHFGTKEDLVLEVFARRLRPLNRDRIARLDALEAEAEGQPVPLEKIVEAIVRPSVEARETQPGTTMALFRLICRGFQDPNPQLKAFLNKECAEFATRMDAALLRALPWLPPQELVWRERFLFGALNHGLDSWVHFDNLPHPNPEMQPMRPDREGFIRRMVSFIAAGLSAPLA